MQQTPSKKSAWFVAGQSAVAHAQLGVIVTSLVATFPNLTVGVQFNTVIAEIFVLDLISYISYFSLKVRNLVAYGNHARIAVYVTPPSLYENLLRTKDRERWSTKFLRVRKFLRLQ